MVKEVVSAKIVAEYQSEVLPRTLLFLMLLLISPFLFVIFSVNRKLWCSVVEEIKLSWRRDIVGYTLWCTDDVGGLVHYYVANRNDKPDRLPGLALVLPLGGWFREAAHVGGSLSGVFRRWSIEFIDTNFDSVLVRLTDRTDGTTGAINVVVALALLDRRKGSGGPLVELTQKLLGENAALKEQIASLTKEQQAARAVSRGLLDLVGNTAKAIADTSRLGKSREGQRIREDLEAALRVQGANNQ